MTTSEKELVGRIHASNYRLLDELDRLSKQYDFKYYLAYGGLLGAVRHTDFIPWDDDVDVMMFPKDLDKLCAVRDQLSEGFRLVMPDDYGDKYYDLVPRINDTSLHILSEDSKVTAFYGGGLRDYAALDLFLMGRDPGGLRGKIYKMRLKFWYGMQGAHRCPTLSHVKGGVLGLAKRVLMVAGKLYSATAIRGKCMDLVRKYEDREDYEIFTANGDMVDMRTNLPADAFKEIVMLPMKPPHTYPAPKGYEEVLRRQYGDYMQLPPEDQQHPHSIYK